MADSIDTVLSPQETLVSGTYRTWCQGVATIRPQLPENPLSRAYEIGKLLAQRASDPYTFLYDVPYLEQEQARAFEALGYRPPQDNVVPIKRSA